MEQNQTSKRPGSPRGSPEDSTPRVLLQGPTGQLLYLPRFWPRSCLAELDASIPWRQDHMRIFGRMIPLPRRTSWHGDPEAVYHYSGIRNDPQPWTPLLTHLRKRLEEVTALRFNAVLLNRYEQGSDHQGYHADDEPELGPEPQVASLSFGATRRFLVRSRDGKGRLKVDLEDRSLLLMLGAFQRHYLHAVARTARPVGLRINLTFRLVSPASFGLLSSSKEPPA